MAANILVDSFSAMIFDIFDRTEIFALFAIDPNMIRKYIPTGVRIDPIDRVARISDNVPTIHISISDNLHTFDRNGIAIIVTMGPLMAPIIDMKLYISKFQK